MALRHQLAAFQQALPSLICWLLLLLCKVALAQSMVCSLTGTSMHTSFIFHCSKDKDPMSLTSWHLMCRARLTTLLPGPPHGTITKCTASQPMNSGLPLTQAAEV